MNLDSRAIPGKHAAQQAGLWWELQTQCPRRRVNSWTELGEPTLLSQVPASISAAHSMPQGLQAQPTPKDKHRPGSAGAARLKTLPPPPTAQTKLKPFSRRAAPREEPSGQTTPSSTWKPACLRDKAHDGQNRCCTHLNDGGVLGQRVLGFRGFTHRDVLDVAPPEDDVLVNLLPRRGRPVRGPVFSAEGPHFGVEEKGAKSLSSRSRSWPPGTGFATRHARSGSAQWTIPTRPRRAKLQKVPSQLRA